MKNNELKKYAKAKAINLDGCDQTVNAALRKRILECSQDYQFVNNIILSATTPDMKKFFSKIEKNYPKFYLFRAESVSNENEKFIQDPVKVVVSTVLSKYENELNKIAQRINNELGAALGEVSDELDKLAPSLSTKFAPHNVQAMWEKAYSAVNFCDENDIPLATRGSGMRRLALLSFFRVYSRAAVRGSSAVFAIEEPEAFLHPDLQREVWNSLTELSEDGVTQVIITSHSSNLIEKTDVRQVRYIEKNRVHSVSSLQDKKATRDFVGRIEQSLGKFRDTSIDLFLLVEGRNDIVSLEGLGKNTACADFVEFGDHIKEGRILVLPIGGTGSINLWTDGRLSDFSKPVVFLKDLDDRQVESCTVEELVDKFDRGEDCVVVSHSAREMENFLSVSVISRELGEAWGFDSGILSDGLQACGLTLDSWNNCDVPTACVSAKSYIECDGEPIEVPVNILSKRESKVKKILAAAFSDLDSTSIDRLMDSNFGVMVKAINNYLR